MLLSSDIYQPTQLFFKGGLCFLSFEGSWDSLCISTTLSGDVIVEDQRIETTGFGDIQSWVWLPRLPSPSCFTQCNSHSSLFCRPAIPVPLLESTSSQMPITWFKWALPGSYCSWPHASVWLWLSQKRAKLLQWEPSRGGCTGDQEHRPVSVGSKALGDRGTLLSEGTDIQRELEGRETELEHLSPCFQDGAAFLPFSS